MCPRRRPGRLARGPAGGVTRGGAGTVPYLWTSPATGNDAWGNRYIDVPVAAHASGEGALTLRNLSIAYDYTADVADFSVELNDYLEAHRDERDAAGNLTVPVNVRSGTPGKVRLHGLNFTTDEAPRLVLRIPDLPLDEDTAATGLLCLRNYFLDDNTPGGELKFTLSVLTNESIVRVALENGENITADAAFGPLNDNWTGTVELVVTASDGRGSTTVTDPFLLDVKSVPEPPVITSAPPTDGLGGRPYCYNLTADDGDNDALTYAPRASDHLTSE